MIRHLLMFSAVVFATQQGLLAEPGDLVKSSVIDSDVAYLRIGTVGKNLPAEIRSAQSALASSNIIAGAVLDLRFANGADADSARAVVDLFATKKLPLAVLVNAQTGGAAIALANDVRDERAGLVFGTVTGELKPDVVVPVEAIDEKVFLENPYGTLSTNRFYLVSEGTNDFLPLVDHTSEADLVRARIKDGEEDDSLQRRSAEPPAPFIRDPALARGIDFIRGWAALRWSHS
jgi:hypothetical protein